MLGSLLSSSNQGRSQTSTYRLNSASSSERLHASIPYASSALYAANAISSHYFEHAALTLGAHADATTSHGNPTHSALQHQPVPDQSKSELHLLTSQLLK